MVKRMLVDATHPEETRVVVVDGTKLDEFDFEAASRKPLKGNIYLAKVVRIEPSLQAAFVEYGGNRHGFLAFNEIHPDYYQIPVADREALMREEAEDEDDHHEPRGRRGNHAASEPSEDGEDDEVEASNEDDDDVTRARRAFLASRFGCDSLGARRSRCRFGQGAVRQRFGLVRSRFDEKTRR